MTDQEKQKYYGNEAFETIYEKTKKDYVPQQMSYTPLDEKIGSAQRSGPCKRRPSPPSSGGTNTRSPSWTRTLSPGAWAAAPSCPI